MTQDVIQSTTLTRLSTTRTAKAFAPQARAGTDTADSPWRQAPGKPPARTHTDFSSHPRGPKTPKATSASLHSFQRTSAESDQVRDTGLPSLSSEPKLQEPEEGLPPDGPNRWGLPVVHRNAARRRESALASKLPSPEGRRVKRITGLESSAKIAII